MSISKRMHTSMLRKSILTGLLLAVGIYLLTQWVFPGLRAQDANVPFASMAWAPLDIAVYAAALAGAMYTLWYVSNLNEKRIDSWFVVTLSVSIGSLITAGATIAATMIGGWFYGLMYMTAAALLCGWFIAVITIICKRFQKTSRRPRPFRPSHPLRPSRPSRLNPRNRTHHQWRILNWLRNWLRAEDVPKEDGDGEYGD